MSPYFMLNTFSYRLQPGIWEMGSVLHNTILHGKGTDSFTLLM